MMKKRNRKQVKANATRILREAKPSKEQMPVQKQEVFSSVCENVILHHEEINETSVDYYFCKAVIARETKEFKTERQAVLNLILFSDTPTTPLIQSALDQDEQYQFSEQICAVFLLAKSEASLNPYMAIIRAFILSGTKQQYATYFNCLMGISAFFNKDLPIFDISKLSNA